MNVFLSYSQKDKDFVQNVRNYLAHHDINTLDIQGELVVGDSPFSKIDDAIEKSDALIPFILINYANEAQSLWQRFLTKFSVNIAFHALQDSSKISS